MNESKGRKMVPASEQYRDPVRLSVNLAPDVADALKTLAARRGKTITEVIRDAISTEKFLDDEQRSDSKILVEEKDGTKKQLVWVK